jgi:hypothetical protein
VTEVGFRSSEQKKMTDFLQRKVPVLHITHRTTICRQLLQELNCAHVYIIRKEADHLVTIDTCTVKKRKKADVPVQLKKQKETIIRRHARTISAC